MKMKWTLLLIGGLAASMPGVAVGADLRPMVVDDVTGTLRIQQSLPLTCDDIDLTVPVLHGRLDIAPAEPIAVSGGHMFMLARGTIAFSGFSIHRSCLTEDVTRNYTDVKVQVAEGVAFVATEGPTDVFTFSIPAADVVLLEASVVNGTLETGYKRPRDPVTGTIDLVHGTVSMHVVVATNIHVDGLGDYGGSLTANLSGTLDFPDTDGDGVVDRSDNCKFVANADQLPVSTPIITAPEDIQVATCAYSLPVVATAADICDGGPVTVSNNAPGTFPVGPTTVTWTAEDSQSRTATDDQIVTVVDTTLPTFTFVPPNITMADCGTADLGLPIATDDCAGTPVLTNDAPPTYGPGTTVVTWTATDASGNQTTAVQTVTVNDLTPPVVACTLTGKRSDGVFLLSTTDNCPNPVMTLGSYTVANGETIKITQSPGFAGVNLIGTVGTPPSRYFRVGTGDAVITSTDTSGNSASVSCPVPPK